MSITSKIFFLSILVVLLAGCGGAGEPRRIGSYPSTASGTSDYYQHPEAAVIVYHSHMNLEVNSISKTSDRIIDLSHDYGGYIIRSQVWYENSTDNATIVIGVPVFNYDAIRQEILQLGKLKDETVTGEIHPSDYPTWDYLTMSTITVHLSHHDYFVGDIPNKWHPVDTFLQALGVAGSIFRFVFDLVIWVVVIVGPFVLMGWGIRTLLARYRQPTQSNKEIDK